MIPFACASCSRTLEVEDAHAGEARCPFCGHVMAVPLPSPAAGPPTRGFTGQDAPGVPAAPASPPAPAAGARSPEPAAADEARTMPPLAEAGPDAFATMPPALREGHGRADSLAPPG